jgi:hypothetical protein
LSSREDRPGQQGQCHHLERQHRQPRRADPGQVGQPAAVGEGEDGADAHDAQDAIGNDGDQGRDDAGEGDAAAAAEGRAAPDQHDEAGEQHRSDHQGVGNDEERQQFSLRASGVVVPIVDLYGCPGSTFPWRRRGVLRFSPPSGLRRTRWPQAPVPPSVTA